MGRFYIKTIYGREYKYERISTKRVNGKVVTKDVYHGAVKPVQGKLALMSAGDLKQIEKFWKKGSSPETMVAAVHRYTGRTYAVSTISKFCREKFGKRGKK